MAASDERRMLFDIRGRRKKNVIRVVYALLAILMGASLFVAVGPFNLTELLGTGGSGKSAADVLDETAERIERRLVKSPKDDGLLLSLTRTRIAAGNARTEEDPSTGARVVTPEARSEFEAAHEAWEGYLGATKEPSPTAAQLVAGSYFGLAESSGTLGEIDEALAGAAKTQKIAAVARPNVNSLTTLAIYQYYNGEFAAGDKTGKRAEAEAPSKSQAKTIEKQLAVYRKRGKAWNKQAEKLAKIQQKQGKEKLQNPLGGFSGGTGVAP